MTLPALSARVPVAVPKAPALPTATVPALSVNPPVKVLAPERVRMPEPSLTTEPVVLPPKAVPRVTLLAPMSRVAMVAATMASRAEMSWVLPEAQSSVPPFMVMLPVEPREPLEKVTVPALTVVPPV